MSSTHTYILDENEGNSSQQASSMSLNEPEDEDDICPVCESECTCANRSRNTISLPTARDYSTGYIVQDASKKNSGKTSPIARPASLKIKLTLPPRPQQHHASGSTKPSSRRSFLPKQKFTENTEEESENDIPCNSLTSALSEPAISGRARDAHYKVDASLPKKRGRPTKAVIAAREAAKHTTEVRRLKGVTDQSIDNVVVARQSESSTSHGVPRVKSSSNGKNKSKKIAGATSVSRARARRLKAPTKTRVRRKKHQATVDGNESSELSELDDDDDHPFGLPTFVPAFSSSSNGSSSDSGSDTDSDLDKGIPPEPRPQQIPSLLLADNEYAQRKREYHNTWDIRVRKRSVGAEGSSDEGMDTDSGENAEEEEEGDDEADENDEDADADADDASMQQFIRYSGIATGWTDDEESSFDADLFFANLSDSSDEEGGDEQMAVGKDTSMGQNVQHEIRDVPSAAGFDAFRLSEIAAAGFLAPFADLDRSTLDNLPFGQGWDQLSLTNAFRDNLMDLDAESSRRLPLGSLLEPPIPGYEEAEAMMATSEEEEAVAMFDNCSQVPEEEEVLEIFEGSDGGETTEDEFVNVDGIATPRREVLLRFPASLGAIDPMSTLSSPLKGPSERDIPSSPLVRFRDPSGSVPKQSDVLSKGKFVQERKETMQSRSTSQSYKQATSTPKMGSFVTRASGKVKSAVIARSEGSSRNVIPCPYPAVRRLRGRGTSVSMLSRSGSDRSSHSRTQSLLAAARSPFDNFASGDFDSPDDGQLQPGEPIQIDDVIDSKFLVPENSDPAIPESTTSETGETGETCESESERDRYLENLRRWDRIPIDAFRKTRTLGAANDLTADKMNIVISTPRAPRPSDGFSYGSAAGAMLRGSPLNATLWESSAQTLHHSGMTSDNGRGKLSSLLVSPVLLPSREGDRTPTAEHQQQRHQQLGLLGIAGQHAAYTQQNIRSRKELRKEKKRNRKFISSATTHVRHNHFPNAKSRATSSMQRIPSLSL